MIKILKLTSTLGKRIIKHTLRLALRFLQKHPQFSRYTKKLLRRIPGLETRLKFLGQSKADPYQQYQLSNHARKIHQQLIHIARNNKR